MAAFYRTCSLDLSTSVVAKKSAPRLRLKLLSVPLICLMSFGPHIRSQCLAADQPFKADVSSNQVDDQITKPSHRPIVIAHRGASGYLPEHTTEAVSLAYGQRADFIEQDVVLSKDGHPMVLHDIYLDTVTDVVKRFPNRRRSDGRYYAIDFTLAELKTLRVRERFDYQSGKRIFPNRFRSIEFPFRIPTLAEELALISGLNTSTGRKVGVYIEVKKPKFHLTAGQDMVPNILQTLKEQGYSAELAKSGQKPVYLQCFDSTTLKRLSEMKTGFPLIQLIADDSWGESDDNYQAMVSAAGVRKIANYADGIGPWTGHIYLGKDSKGAAKITDLVANAHQAGLLVHPFTFRVDDLPNQVQSYEELMELFAGRLKVDGFFTDFPDRTRAWLESRDN